MPIVFNPIEKASKKNSFKITVFYMHGDGDSESEDTWYLPKDSSEAVLEREIKLLKSFTSYDYNDFVTYHMGNNSIDRKKRADTLSAMTGFESAFCFNWLLDHEKHNAVYGLNSIAIAEDFKIVFLDESGVEHSVSLVE